MSRTPYAASACLSGVARLDGLERFLQDTAQPLPTLTKTALIHLQFETVYPFLDGNGCIQRLLIAALLEHWRLPLSLKCGP